MSKAKSIGLWTLQVLLAAAFLMTGSSKLGGNPHWQKHFGEWGYPDNFYLLIGALEALGALGLLIPKLSVYAASGLIALMVGALFTHLLNGQTLQVLRPVIFMMFLAVVGYARRPEFLRQRQRQPT